MRTSAVIVSVAALAGSAFASKPEVANLVARHGPGESVVPVQQIGDGQIQNPATPVAPKPTPAPTPKPVAPPPEFGNVTSTITGTKTLTSSVIKTTPPLVGPPAATATAPKPSVPAIQTGAANSMVAGSVGLGLAALVAFLG